MLMIFTWGGFRFIFYSLSLATLISFFIGKVNKKETISYFLWFIPGFLFLGIKSGFGVAAFDVKNDGIISPGGIGYDINCGVRLLKSNLSFKDVEPYLESLARELYSEIPSGVGKGGKLRLNDDDFDEVLKHGAKWMIEKGYGEKNG